MDHDAKALWAVTCPHSFRLCQAAAATGSLFPIWRAPCMARAFAIQEA